MVMEVGAGISMFAYRAKLEEGFDQGLTRAMMNYRTDSNNMALNFDTMQETVRKYVLIDKFAHFMLINTNILDSA